MADGFVQINAKLQLDIYPFNWKFFVFKTDHQPKAVTMNYFIKPLLKVIGKLDIEKKTT